MQDVRKNSEFLWEIDERRATQTDDLGIARGQEEPIEHVASHIRLCPVTKSRLPVCRPNLFGGDETAQTGQFDQIGIYRALHQPYQIVNFIHHDHGVVEEVAVGFLAGHRL